MKGILFSILYLVTQKPRIVPLICAASIIQAKIISKLSLSYEVLRQPGGHAVQTANGNNIYMVKWLSSYTPIFYVTVPNIITNILLIGRKETRYY